MKSLELNQMENVNGGWGKEACLFAAGAAIGSVFFPPYAIVAAFSGLACAVGAVIDD